jgi:hypothetical protein
VRFAAGVGSSAGEGGTRADTAADTAGESAAAAGTALGSGSAAAAAAAGSDSLRDSWACRACSRANPARMRSCRVCGTTREKRSPAERDKALANTQQKAQAKAAKAAGERDWQCAACGRANGCALRECRVCKTKRKQDPQGPMPAADSGAGAGAGAGDPDTQALGDSWQCRACTRANKPSQVCCTVCGYKRPVFGHVKLALKVVEKAKSEQWPCAVCKRQNGIGLQACRVCKSLRPRAHAAHQPPPGATE